jgi:ABC-type polysaccharide/polyol phosphate export permease
MANDAMPHSLSLLWRQFRIEWKLYLRDRAAMFWTFAFPLLMLFAFGVIFRSGGSPSLTLVRVASAPDTGRDRLLLRALEESHLKVVTLDARAAEDRWKKGETTAQLESDGGHYRLRLNSYLIGQGQVIALAANQAFLIAQARASGGREPEKIPLSVESPGHARAQNYAAFLVPGLVGLNLLSTGLFSVGMVTVAYREKGKYRRTALLLLAARFGFGIENQGSYLLFAALVVFGTATFIAMGFALSSFAATVETYGAVSNLAFFPMMLLSGVYYRLDNAPQWQQKSVFVLPLSPFLRALRAVFNDGATLAGHAAGLTIVAAWAMLSFAFAVKRFRWV